MSQLPEFSPQEYKYWRVVENDLVSYDLSQKNWLGRKVRQFFMWMGWSKASFSKVVDYLVLHRDRLSSLDETKRRLLLEKMVHYGNQRPRKRTLTNKIQQIVDEWQRMPTSNLESDKKPVVPPPKPVPPKPVPPKPTPPPIQYKNIEGIRFPVEKEDVYFHSERVLPPPPVNGIQVGLPNIGNTCWLNSILQLMASNTYLDPLLTHELKDKENKTVRNLFQAAFRALISDMRLGKQMDRERMRFCGLFGQGDAQSAK